MNKRWLMPAGVAAAALIAAGCGSSGGSASAPTGNTHTAAAPAANGGTAASGSALKSAKIGSVVVLTDAKGFTLYWFAIDTATKSNCSGACAAYWPPVIGAQTSGSGISGKFGTIRRSDGSLQTTYNGHPLYTYLADSAPGQTRGNNINLNGGLWHEVVVTG